MKFALSFILLLSSIFGNAQIGNPAPDFTVTDINGNTHRLYDYIEAGKIVVLDFYYTTCGPCIFYSPQVNLAYEKYGCNTANVVFLSIDYNDTDSEVEAYDNEYAIEFPSISGLEGGGNGVVSQYGIIGFPTFYVIDSSKTILDVIDPPTLQVFDFRFQMHGILPASCATSTEDQQAENGKLTFYPNPISPGEALQIEMPEPRMDKLQLDIYDFTGRLVQHRELNVNGEMIIQTELHSQCPGMYFATLRPAKDQRMYIGVFEILK